MLQLKLEPCFWALSANAMILVLPNSEELCRHWMYSDDCFGHISFDLLFMNQQIFVVLASIAAG